jgi:hypothetical protein
VTTPLRELRQQLPRGAILTAYSGYIARLGSAPAEYGQVFIYADADEVGRAFKPTARERRNLFVLEPDEHLRSLSENGVAPLVQIYVDLWQLGSPASRFVEELDRKFEAAATRALAALKFRER